MKMPPCVTPGLITFLASSSAFSSTFFRISRRRCATSLCCSSVARRCACCSDPTRRPPSRRRARFLSCSLAGGWAGACSKCGGGPRRRNMDGPSKAALALCRRCAPTQRRCLLAAPLSPYLPVLVWHHDGGRNARPAHFVLLRPWGLARGRVIPPSARVRRENRHRLLHGRRLLPPAWLATMSIPKGDAKPLRAAMPMRLRFLQRVRGRPSCATARTSALRTRAMPRGTRHRASKGGSRPQARKKRGRRCHPDPPFPQLLQLLREVLQRGRAGHQTPLRTAVLEVSPLSSLGATNPSGRPPRPCNSIVQCKVPRGHPRCFLGCLTRGCQSLKAWS